MDVIIVLCVCVILIFVFFVIIWRINIDLSSCTVKMKFKAFKRFYVINPINWYFKDTYYFPVYRGCKDERGRVIFYGIKFNFIDWYKYILWRILENYRTKQQDRAKEQFKIIQSIKRDIAEYEKQTKQDVDDILKKIREEKK